MFRFGTKPLAFLLFLLSLQLTISAATPYSWRSVAISGGGFVPGIVFHPKQRNLVYCRTDVGGAYRWSADTQSWIALNDDISADDSQMLGVLAIAVDPNDANTVYLACGQYLAWWGHNGAILRSSDQGATWTRSDLTIKLGGNADGRSAGERLMVDPNASNILFLATNQDGLWKSTDSGSTWVRVPGFTATGATTIVFDPQSKYASNVSQTIYVGADSTAGSLYRSTDGGTTWAQVPGQPTGLKAYRAVMDRNGALLCVFNDGLGPNSVNSGAIWKFQPSTSAWTNITPPAGQGGYGGISVDPNNASTLITSTLDRWNTGDQVFRTTDGGTSWKAILNRSALDYSSAPWAAQGLSPHWMGDAEMDPFDPAHLLFGTGYGVFSTTTAANADAGSVVWAFSNKGLEETVPLAIVSPPVGVSLISAIGDFDGFRHELLDTSPSSRLSPTIGTCQGLAYAGQAPEIMVRIGSNVAQYTLNSGASWIQFPTAPSLASGSGNVTVSADGSSFVWVPTNSVPYVSTNRGGTWTAATGFTKSTETLEPVADRINASKFYVIQTTQGILYRSTNGGASFAAAASGLPTGASELAAVPGFEGHLWLACGDGKALYRSTDSGTSFTKISAVQKADRVGFGKAAPGSDYPTIFIHGSIASVDGIYRSDDAGATWQRINDNAHRFGWINGITGDPRIYGRVYLATGGRGIVYGDIGTPVITTQPSSQAAALGSKVSLEVAYSGASGIQWYKDGAKIPGATRGVFAISSFQTSDAGSYLAVLSGLTGDLSSSVATLSIAPAIVSKLSAISTRSFVGPQENAMIAGFAIVGTQPKRVLIRAGGPALLAQSVSDFLPDPVVTLYDSAQRVLASNDDWDSSAAAGIDEASKRFQAGAWTPGSKDAAMIVTLAPGNYSAVVDGKNGATGVAIAEVYDVDETPTASKLLAISTRSLVKTGSKVQIGGFVIAGPSKMRVVIRSVGPSLPSFITNPLKNPQIDLHQGAPILSSNDDWGSTLAMRTAFAATWMAPLLDGSKDSALIVTLDPGAYSTIVSGVGDTEGIGLVEVYEYAQ